ncbi:hypothetical protein Y032_0155g3061 [Ancylostoma ceylanicum]|uniref:Uncharacterized protein n=1 Tax=Ancylostoma ceylanicum TaxID=53326 RepID=A0A016SZH2_9BILA|nr:hypothetical protein Y032_0155g3061 [Ancylostoma ceylanicum]
MESLLLSKNLGCVSSLGENGRSQVTLIGALGPPVTPIFLNSSTGIDCNTCQIQEYVSNKLTHVVESALLNITEWRGTRLSYKGTCLDHLRQDLTCLHEIVEGAERALKMDLGTGSEANISFISGTFSLELWQMPIETTRFHNLMSTRVR